MKSFDEAVDYVFEHSDYIESRADFILKVQNNPKVLQFLLFVLGNSDVKNMGAAMLHAFSQGVLVGQEMFTPE